MSGALYGETFEAAQFEASRYRSPEGVARWCDRIGAWFEVSMLQTRVLDVGSGTGIWSEAIADRFDVEVVGVEPGAGMLPRAAGRRSHPLVSFVGGTAEAIPLRDSSVTAGWMSTVVHHIPDLPAAAQELRRVLATPAPLLIRNWFADRLESLELVQHFPTARQRMEGWKTLGEVVDIFERAGFGFAGLEQIAEHTRTYDDILQALPRQRHTDSCLVDVDDAEWEAGLASIRRRQASGATPTPFQLDLLVFH